MDRSDFAACMGSTLDCQQGTLRDRTRKGIDLFFHQRLEPLFLLPIDVLNVSRCELNSAYLLDHIFCLELKTQT